MNAQGLTHALGGKWHGKHGMASCPSHLDKNPSLAIRDGDDGKVLFKCHAGCPQDAVLDGLKQRGLWNDCSVSFVPKKQPDKWTPITPVPADASRTMPEHPQHGKHSARWLYHDAEGRLLGIVCRFDRGKGKDVIPLVFCAGPGGRREWRWRGFPSPRPLYGLDRLAQDVAGDVLVVEGEKAADAAQERFPDMVVITWPGGVNAVASADWSPLRSRAVVVWPDNDAPGMKAAQAVVRACTAAGTATVWVVALPPGLPAKWDLADDLPEGWTSETPQLLLSEANAVDVEVDAPGAESDSATILRLAGMRPFDYERVRQAEAKLLRVRAPILDRMVAKKRGDDVSESGGSAVLFAEPEPWPDPVDGAGLLDALADTFTRHVVLPAGGADAVALWTLHAHAHDTAAISPILAITSPTPECGKTTLLTLLGALVPKPLPFSNVTAAALFRAVEKWRPTMLVDEADSFLRDSDELRGIINSGHNRGAAFVVRTAGDDHEPRRFMTWAPKAIALIGKLPPTLASRAIHINMRRLGPGETVEPVRADRLGHLEPLLRQATRWTEDRDAALRDAEPDTPAILTGRRADNWRCLLAVGDVAGRDWPERARRAAETLSAGRSDETAAILLLADIRDIFAERGVDRIASGDLALALAEREDRPWPEWRRGKPITPHGIARLLEPFGVTPTKFRAAGHTPGTRGYNGAAFTEVFSRYFPDTGDPTATPPQVNKTGPFSDFASATPAQSVAVGKPPKPNVTAACGGVAVEDAPPWETNL